MEDNTPHIVTDDNATAWWRWFTRRVVLLPLAAIVAVSIGVWVFASVSNNMDQTAPDAADQKSLETNLLSAKASYNAEGVVTLSTRLIEGEEKGTYVYSDAQLSDLYLDRANSYLNLNKNKEAVPDFQKAKGLAESRKIAALQGEVEARYKLGERKQLIPLYQQLVSLVGGSENPRRGSVVEQYQTNIQLLQSGQEIPY
jgi:tetratricopeptide (TPR) repeat protein